MGVEGGCGVMEKEENNLRERVLPKEYANLVEKYRCLGAENKELREINNNLRESLEFATGFCKKCDETACPVRKSLQRARGERVGFERYVSLPGEIVDVDKDLAEGLILIDDAKEVS